MPNEQLNDIVYVLKQNIDPYELTYSLRSIEKNFPHRKVWFIGSKPEGLTPDGSIYHQQTGNTKGGLIKSSLWKAITSKDITEDFFWFNDDFFVMKPVDPSKFINFVDGTLERRIQELYKDAGPGPYMRELLKCQQELLIKKQTQMNFDVHLPLLMNKSLAVKSVNQCSSPQFRSFYGNFNKLPYEVMPDVKVYSLTSVPTESTYLSTNDETFRDGAVGRYIREVFSKPSRFEV